MAEITVFGFPHSSFVHIAQLVLKPPIEHARKWFDSHRPKY
jgi:hypothetical protein